MAFAGLPFPQFVVHFGPGVAPVAVRTYVRTMTATFFKMTMACPNCSAEWQCLGDPDDPLTRFCPECASQWVSVEPDISEWRPGDFRVGSPDPLTRAVELIRLVFGPGVTEVEGFEALDA